MRVPGFEVLVTALLVLGFACVGEVLLWRRSGRHLFAWNESFLVGAGTCAAALFPLSLVWPSGALRATLGAMIAAAAVRLGRELGPRRSRTHAPPARARSLWFDPVAAGLILLLACVTLAFAALNFRYNYLWDGFQIWAARASVLYHEGGLTRWWFPEESYDQRLLTYPPLVPLFEALVSVVRGGFDFDLLKPVFLVFYLSMVISTYAAAREGANARVGLAAALLLALLAPLSTSYAAGAYADMPQAALVAGTVAAGRRRLGTRSALPWLIGGLTTVKSEGTVLAVLAIAAVLLALLLQGPSRGLFSSHRWGGLIVATFVAIRIGYVRWLGLRDVVYGPFDAAHFSAALRRLPLVGVLCARALLRLTDWGLFWPAFFAATVILAMRGAPRERSLAAATAAGIIAAAIPFLFTTWDVPLHVAQAYFRLLAQIAPAAAVTVAAGYVRAAAAAADGPETPGDKGS